jgi:hypothetical protein
VACHQQNWPRQFFCLPLVSHHMTEPHGLPPTKQATPLVSHHMTEPHGLPPTEQAAPPKSLLPRSVKGFIKLK